MEKVNRPPTLKTIAYMTGFSVTAVSRALKDAPDISAQTKERVRLVAKQIGYRPSRAGLRLRTGKTQVICLILNVDEKIMSLTSQMVSGISAHLKGSNYHLVVMPYSDNDDPLEPVKYVVETGSADVVIISRMEPDDIRVRYLMDNNMPFVTHGRTLSNLPHAWVDYDNERFAYKGIERLNHLGCRSVSTVFPVPHLTYWRDLQSGFEKGLAEFDMTERRLPDIVLENTMDEIEEGVAKLMRSPNRPDGILSAAGSASIAITSGIERAGLEVGRDVQLVSKQSTRILERFRPAINVFFEDVPETGRVLAEHALKLMQGHDPHSLSCLIFEDFVEHNRPHKNHPV